MLFISSVAIVILIVGVVHICLGLYALDQAEDEPNLLMSASLRNNALQKLKYSGAAIIVAILWLIFG